MAMFVDKCVYASLYDMCFASFMLYASLMPCFMMQNTMLNIYAYANYMWEYMQVYVTWYASYACDFIYAKYLIVCMLSVWVYAS